MNIKELSDAEKHILLGNLLKKDYPEPLSIKILDYCRGPKSIEQKIDFLIQIREKLKINNETRGENTVSEQKSPEKGIERKEEKVLIAHPDASFFKSIQNSRLKKKFHFSWAKDGPSCINFIKKEVFYYIILYHDIPVFDSRDILEYILSLKTGTRCFYLIPSHSHELSSTLLNNPRVTYVHKNEGINGLIEQII